MTDIIEQIETMLLIDITLDDLPVTKQIVREAIIEIQRLRQELAKARGDALKEASSLCGEIADGFYELDRNGAVACEIAIEALAAKEI